MLNLIASLIILIIGVVFIVYICKALNENESYLSIVYILMNCSMAIFSFGYSLELISTSISMAYISIKLKYFGLVLLTLYWIIIAYKFKNNSYPSFKNYIYLSIVPFLTLFSLVTNEYHNYYYSNIKIINQKNFFYVQTEKGILYYIFVIYTYVVLIILIKVLYKSYKFNNNQRKNQNKILIISLIIPLIFNLFYLFEIIPSSIDPTSFGFLIMSYFIYKAIFKYSFLDLKDSIRCSIYENVKECIFVLDDKYRIVEFNHQAHITLDFFENKNIGNFIENHKVGKMIVEKSKNSDIFDLFIETEEKLYIYNFKKNPIFLKTNLVAYVYIVSDVTSLKAEITDLSYIASHDYLTGVYNRMSFTKEAQKALEKLNRYGGELSVIMLDIDFFKKINDNFGHMIGDEVLAKLAKTITVNLRSNDILGRLGGEEFCILLPETNLNNAFIISEKIRRIIELTEFYWKKGHIHITISLGISSYNNKMNRISLAELLDLADKALYLSKNTGRNRTSLINQQLITIEEGNK